MKRYGYLYHKITSFNNLFIASKNAQKSKRFRPQVLAFNHSLEHNLLELQTQLQQKTYQPGEYYNFEIYEPKPRIISAAPYRDRIIHHALCQIIQPIFERTFIHHSYANRKDKGTHRALRHYSQCVLKYEYVLQCDIRRYFPSIHHATLKALIRRKIKCPDTLWLIDRIIDNSPILEPSCPSSPACTGSASRAQPPREIPSSSSPTIDRIGIPIGNLTSQFFANLYLNSLDHHICEQLKPAGYLRYVDDFALFSNDRDFLYTARKAIEQHLATLHLEIHPIKSQIFKTRTGCNFVGFRIFPDRIRIRNSNLRRARIRIKHFKESDPPAPLVTIQQSIQSWNAHLSHADTHNLRQTIQAKFPTDWLS
jgi:RNA-directed DNA polymerase